MFPGGGGCPIKMTEIPVGKFYLKGKTLKVTRISFFVGVAKPKRQKNKK